MKQLEVLLSKETFNYVKICVESYFEKETGFLTAKVELKNKIPKNKNWFSVQEGNVRHVFINKDEYSIKNGQYRIHTDKSQSKFLVRVDDAEKSICSGFDCKGNWFENEYTKLTRTVDIDDKIEEWHDSKEDVTLVEFLGISEETYSKYLTGF